MANKRSVYELAFVLAAQTNNEFNQAINNATAQLMKLAGSEQEAMQIAEQFTQQTNNGFMAAADVILNSQIVEGLNEIKDAFAECVRTAAEYEATMSTVEALSGASAKEMEALSQEAKALGASTVWTAKQAGDAMSYMAMAGWDTQEILVGMADVLNLASAGGTDLATTASIVTDSLTALD